MSLYSTVINLNCIIIKKKMASYKSKIWIKIYYYYYTYIIFISISLKKVIVKKVIYCLHIILIIFLNILHPGYRQW